MDADTGACCPLASHPLHTVLGHGLAGPDWPAALCALHARLVEGSVSVAAVHAYVDAHHVCEGGGEYDEVFTPTGCVVNLIADEHAHRASAHGRA